MRYSDLLKILKKNGLDSVGKLTHENDAVIYIGRPSDVCFPMQFDFHTIYAPAGDGDFHVHREVIKALARRFNLPESEFLQTH